MTARPRLEVRMLVRALKLQLPDGGTLVSALSALVTQKWAANVVKGQTVLSTSEAGGSVTFTFERAYRPAELAVMAEEALEWVNTLADPENPPLDVAEFSAKIGFREAAAHRGSALAWWEMSSALGGVSRK